MLTDTAAAAASQLHAKLLAPPTQHVPIATGVLR